MSEEHTKKTPYYLALKVMLYYILFKFWKDLIRYGLCISTEWKRSLATVVVIACISFLTTRYVNWEDCSYAGVRYIFYMATYIYIAWSFLVFTITNEFFARLFSLDTTVEECLEKYKTGRTTFKWIHSTTKQWFVWLFLICFYGIICSLLEQNNCYDTKVISTISLYYITMLFTWLVVLFVQLINILKSNYDDKKIIPK